MTANKPDGLLAKHKLLLAVIASDWATRLDIRVAATIIERYRSDKGNARASLGYLHVATGSDRKAIIASTRRLIEHGPFAVARQGGGTRPTEYALLFDTLTENASSGLEATASGLDSSSGVETTRSSGLETPTSALSSGVETTESLLHVPATSRLHDRGTDPAAPTAQPAPACEPRGPSTAGDGFAALWLAYGYKHKKADARKAYAALPPNADHEAILAAAHAWREAWEAQDKPDAPRKHLSTWLADECWDEEPPRAYQPPARKARKAAARAAEPGPAESVNDNRPRFHNLPDGEFIQSVKAASTIEGDRLLTIRLELAAGGWIEFSTFHSDSDVQEFGKARLAELADIAGCNLNDTEQLIGLAFTARVDGNDVRFSALEAAA